MTTYTLRIKDRTYHNWEIFETSTFQSVEMAINPTSSKMFSNDVFKLNVNNNVDVIHSSVRQQGNIPGVLILNDNKSYGRNKKGRTLYKCDPDDIRLPSFLIPYDKRIPFSKVFQNQYITFSFSEWTEKHPIGTLMNVIGGVDTLTHFYDYQLYCKSLNASIQQFHKQAKLIHISKNYGKIRFGASTQIDQTL